MPPLLHLGLLPHPGTTVPKPGAFLCSSDSVKALHCLGLGLSCLPSLPMGRCAASRAQRRFFTKALGMPPAPTLVTLRGLQCRAVRLAVEHLSPPYYPFLADLLCFVLAGQRNQCRCARDPLNRRNSKPTLVDRR